MLRCPDAEQHNTVRRVGEGIGSTFMSHFAQYYDTGRLLVVLELSNTIKDPVFKV